MSGLHRLRDGQAGTRPSSEGNPAHAQNIHHFAISERAADEDAEHRPIKLKKKYWKEEQAARS